MTQEGSLALSLVRSERRGPESMAILGQVSEDGVGGSSTNVPMEHFPQGLVGSPS